MQAQLDRVVLLVRLRRLEGRVILLAFASGAQDFQDGFDGCQ